MQNKIFKQLSLTMCFTSIILLNISCSSIISSTATNLADNLSQTILNSDDLKTVADGAPAYLLLIDSFLVDSPDNIALLQSASNLYGAYASVFVKDLQRAKRMSKKSLNYAEQALCLSNTEFCQTRTLQFKNFTQLVKKVNQDNLHDWYVLGAAWAVWIKSNSDDVAAIVELPKVKAIMERIIVVDETWDNGTAHLYLGVLKSLIPPALGGKPEQARQHFEQAIMLSNGKNLMVKVIYAKKYARLVFDQTLHDQLLIDVLAADPYQQHFTLMNILAQQKAKVLLENSNEYFE